MILQVVIQQYLVDKAAVACPVVLWQRIGQDQMPGEVFVFFRQLVELFYIEGFTQGASIVPERDLTPGRQTEDILSGGSWS